MKSFRDMNANAVGIISVLVLGVFTGLAFFIGFAHLLEKSYKVEARFTDASGLRSSDAVRYAGVKVGRVESVEADNTAGNVKVVLVVRSHVQVPKQVGAEIALETLLGTKHVRLTGTPNGPDDAIKDVPRADRRIPIERTKTPFDIFELTRIATRGVQQTESDKLNALIGSLADITDDKSDTFRQLLDGLNQVTTAVNSRDTQLQQLLERTDKLSALLADKDTTLVALIDESQGILRLLSARRAQLSKALGEGSEAVQELSRVITANRGAIDAVLTTLHPTLDLVAKHQTDLNQVLAWLGPGQLQQTRAGSHGPWLDVYINSLGPNVAEVLQDLACAVPTPTPPVGCP